MRTLSRLLAALLAGLVLVACAPITPVPEPAANATTATYTDPDGLYTVAYPGDWVAEGGFFANRGEAMPFPHVAIGTSLEFMETSLAYELLPEGGIGVALMAMPKAMLAEAGLTADAPLEESATALMTMMMDDPAQGAPAFEVGQLAGREVARAWFEGETEDGHVTIFEPVAGVLVMAAYVIAPGYRNADLEGQVEEAIASFEFTGTAEDLMAVAMGGS